MATETAIQWTKFPGYDEGWSWNPIKARHKETGKVGHFCVKIDAGCAACYASALNNWRGNGLEYLRKNADKIELYLDEKTLLFPLKTRKKLCFFTNSQTDLFGTDFGVTEEMLARIYAVMALTPQHLYLNLTKRSKARREWLTNISPAHIGLVAAKIVKDNGINNPPERRLITGTKETCGWPLRNVMEGSSIACSKDLHQLDDLVQTPAWKRFVSYEPAIEGVDLSEYLWTHRCGRCEWTGTYTQLSRENEEGEPLCPACGLPEIGKRYDFLWGNSVDFGEAERRNEQDRQSPLDWVILGGESGPNARPFDIQWARDTIRQCREAGVPCFVKQVGAKPFVWSIKPSRWDKEGLGGEPEEYQDYIAFQDKKGGLITEWPEDIRERNFPNVSR